MATHAGYQPDDETGEERAVSIERLTMLVDGVTAIALTLLALDLPVPAGGTTGAMLSSVAAHSKEYLAFAVGFVVIAAHWLAVGRRIQNRAPSGARERA
jgi:uncharacterized membrane protein